MMGAAEVASCRDGPRTAYDHNAGAGLSVPSSGVHRMTLLSRHEERGKDKKRDLRGAENADVNSMPY